MTTAQSCSGPGRHPIAVQGGPPRPGLSGRATVIKPLSALLMLCSSASACADWVQVRSAADTAPEVFIEPSSVRQSGPMSIMRRVWEIRNFSPGLSGKVLSTKTRMEYDCKDRRLRMLEQSQFSAHWARGEPLPGLGTDSLPGPWSDITIGSVMASIFNQVCPHDGSEASLK